ncbi:MAG: zinc-ribbon domain-containing protein [Ruminococcus sp.]|nr:zinc-ribbon domain-containing protein [Ruminococcus sp.]
MAFLDNMDRKLSQFGQGAIKKTKDVSESVRLSGAVREEEAKQSEIYKQIGEYFYQNCADQADDQMKAWCDAVTRSKEIVAQYKEQIRILKGVTYCTNCNAEIPMNSMFCNNCGARVAQPAPAVHTGPVCPNCQAPVETGQLFCTNCGTRIPEPQPVQAPVVEEAPVAETVSAVEEVPVMEEASVAWENMEVTVEEPVVPAIPTCPNCGAEVGEGQAFCTSCGTRL